MTDFGGEKEANRLRNIREHRGCRHGIEKPQFCGFCWTDEEIERQRLEMLDDLRDNLG